MRGNDRPPEGKWRPPRQHRGQGGTFYWDDGRIRIRRHRTPAFHHYYYQSIPRHYIYGGWGSGWYDPWWWGNYWWPAYEHHGYRDVYHYDHYYNEVPVYEAPYYQDARWLTHELHTALTDIAVAWTAGDVELLQAHMTPGVGVAVQYEWEQEEPWVLASPVLLDLVMEALDYQADSQFEFVQVEELEPGLVWAVAEHEFRLEGEGRQSAVQEYIFREYENAWLVEAIVADPAKYWWLEPELLDDAARESARLFDEMERARALD